MSSFTLYILTRYYQSSIISTSLTSMYSHYRYIRDIIANQLIDYLIFIATAHSKIISINYLVNFSFLVIKFNLIEFNKE